MSVNIRRENRFLYEKVVLRENNPSLTATTTTKFFRADRAMRIDKVEYINPTGLVADATNFFNVALNNGATVIANWSSETGEEGSIPVNTFATLTPAVDSADMVLAAGDVLSLVATEGGTATLPAGTLIVHGSYL